MGEKVIDIRFEDLIYCIKMYSTSLNFFYPIRTPLWSHFSGETTIERT